MSDTTLAAALAAAQVELRNPVRRAQNPHFKSRFADLPTCLDSIRPVLAAHGIALVQIPSWADGVLSVTTLLLHGQERLEGILSCSSAGDPQKIGSAITYLRRYALCAMAGVTGDDDDDGEQASRRQGPSEEEPEIPRRQQPTYSEPYAALRGAVSTVVGRGGTVEQADAVVRYATREGARECLSMAAARADEALADAALLALRHALATESAESILESALTDERE